MNPYLSNLQCFFRGFFLKIIRVRPYKTEVLPFLQCRDLPIFSVHFFQQCGVRPVMVPGREKKFTGNKREFPVFFKKFSDLFRIFLFFNTACGIQ